ncbi:MAG: hypothetical protein SV186_02110, partial [Candidatus Nanohaloarchaea archaeon]|nr:hypothetical protein [Candidatus Nanohaloarchaea archaeon]
ALLYMEHKEANRTITPSLVTKIDGDVAYSRGQIRTTAVTSGRNLGEAHAALLVKPQDRPKYVIHIQLSSGSDFLNINIE